MADQHDDRREPAVSRPTSAPPDLVLIVRPHTETGGLSHLVWGGLLPPVGRPVPPALSAYPLSVVLSGSRLRRLLFVFGSSAAEDARRPRGQVGLGMRKCEYFEGGLYMGIERLLERYRVPVLLCDLQDLYARAGSATSSLPRGDREELRGTGSSAVARVAAPARPGLNGCGSSPRTEKRLRGRSGHARGVHGSGGG